MSELWICREQTAKRPYYLEAADMELWTIEELCFYLYQNMERLDETVMGDKLYDWLSGELELPRLSESLRELRRQGRDALWCAWFLLKETGMYSDEELRDIKAYCLALENKDELERQKLKADRLLQNKKYLRCIREYERLLQMGEGKSQYRKLSGDVCHNLGVAYAGLFLFDEAAEWFGKAFERNQRAESAQAYEDARRMAESAQAYGKDSVLTETAMPGNEELWEERLEELKAEYRKMLV